MDSNHHIIQQTKRPLLIAQAVFPFKQILHIQKRHSVKNAVFFLFDDTTYVTIL